MKYSFRQLEVFAAAAHTENISRAADALAMSQSAASGALKDLEQRFGIQLFDRVGKRLQLNEFGRLMRPKVEALLERGQELERDLSNHQDAGQLKVGATLTIGNYLAVEIISQFLREQKNSKVSLEVANTADISRMVANFDLDIGLIEGELQHPDLEVMPWREDELIVFCSPNHPLAKRRKLKDSDLLSATWILRETGSGTRQAFDRAMQGLLPDIDILLELQHTEGIKRAVEAGLGIGCLSEITLKDAFARGNLVPLKVPHRNLHRHFYFILHKLKYRSAGIEQWLHLCRKT